MYKVLIADDELLAIELITAMLNMFPEYEVVASITDASKVLPVIIRDQPDLLLLDINLGSQNGINLAKEIKSLNNDLQIIFITAHAQYAADAFDCNACDYLLKPVSLVRLSKALNRFKEYHEVTHSKNHSSPSTGTLRFNTNHGFILINPEDIYYLEADHVYTSIHTIDNNTHHVSMNIGKIESLLTDKQFVRISRSGIVNKKYIAEVSRKKRVCNLKYNGSSHDIKLSKSGIERLEESFK